MPRITQNALQYGLLPETRYYWRAWESRVRTASRQVRAAYGKSYDQKEVDFSRFTPKNYLLSWATIVAGVEAEKNGYYIVPPHSKWVNDNGNAWLNQVLLESYPSFILAENYLEHIQMPEISKGKILDAVAWVVTEHEPGRREEIPTIMVDILVATNRRHRALVQRIQSGRINGLSMGCDIQFSQCSRCGRIFAEGEDEQCSHLEDEIRQYFTGKDGRRHRTAELCGVPGKKNSCRFTEASWVALQAFGPAVRHGSLRVGDVWTGRPLKAYVPKHRIMEAAKER